MAASIDVDNLDITLSIPKETLFQVVDYALMRMKEQRQETDGKVIEIIQNISIDGADDPEEFASRLTKQLKIDMRTL